MAHPAEVGASMSTIRLVIRSLLKRRAVTVLVILTAGFAIGANCALFSVVRTLFQPLPYPDAPRIVNLSAPVSRFLSSPDIGLRIRDTVATSDLLMHRCAASDESPFQPGSPAQVEWRLRPAAISPECFSVFVVSPIAGRLLIGSDAGAHPRPAVISESVWRGRFGSDGSVLNRVIRIPDTFDDERWLIVGVVPDVFGVPSHSNFWYALDERVFSQDLVPRFATLAPNASVESLRATLPAVDVTSLDDYVRPDGAVALAYVVVATVLFLLVAFVQIGSLLLSRAAARAPEIALQVALGASPTRVRMFFVAEGAILATASLAVALLLTRPCALAIEARLPPELMAGRPLDSSGAGAAAALALTFLGFVLWSSVPVRLFGGISDAGLACTALFGAARVHVTRMRLALLVLQIAFGVAIVYIAGLTYRSFTEANSVDLGFRPHGLFAVPIPAPVVQRDTPTVEARQIEARNNELARQTIAMVRDVPGVVAVTFASTWPMSAPSDTSSLSANDNQTDRVAVLRMPVGVGYSRVVGARLLEGREATDPETTVMPGRGGSPRPGSCEPSSPPEPGTAGSSRGERSPGYYQLRIPCAWSD